VVDKVTLPELIAAFSEMALRRLRFALAAVAACASCVVNPPVEQPDAAPPIVVRERPLSAEAGDRLLRAALDAYKNDAERTALIDAVRRYSSAPLTTGNRIEILVDGPETYAAIEKDLAGARRHIHIETFIFGAGEVGRRFSELLAQKRREGVEVRVLYDSVGSRETPDQFFEELRRADVEVREFRPTNPVDTPALWDLHNRDHRKIIVVDGTVGFTGGINIDSTYSSPSSSKPGPKRGLEDGWRDTHVRIEGPVVAQLQQLFIDTWNEAGEYTHFQAEGGYSSAPPVAGDDLVTIVANDSESDDRSLYGTYLAAVRHSSERLWITHAYFAPNEELIDAIVDAAQRGVDVRLIVPAFTDSKIVLQATRATYTRLLESGVRIYELREALLHAKSVVVDGVVSIVGSANLDMRSFLHNDEVNAIVIDVEVARRMEEVFVRDQRESRVVELSSWERRSLWQRFKENIVSLFSYWI
jgi:cardiolipin synthase